jgi:hypothetical protein
VAGRVLDASGAFGRGLVFCSFREPPPPSCSELTPLPTGCPPGCPAAPRLNCAPGCRNRRPGGQRWQTAMEDCSVSSACGCARAREVLRRSRMAFLACHGISAFDQPTTNCHQHRGPLPTQPNRQFRSASLAAWGPLSKHPLRGPDDRVAGGCTAHVGWRSSRRSSCIDQPTTNSQKLTEPSTLNQLTLH